MDRMITLDPNNQYVDRWLRSLGKRPAALVALIEGDDSLYAQWMRDEFPRSTDADVEAKLKDRHKLVALLRAGIDPETVKDGWATGPWKNMGPMQARIESDGSLSLDEGNHRAVISICLGIYPTIPVTIHRDWTAALAPRTLYQPHPHPALEGCESWRSQESIVKRYGIVHDAVGAWSYYEVGCAEGVGLEAVRQCGAMVTGAETDPISRQLAQSLTGVAIHGEAPEHTECECVILLSVLHHMVQSIESERYWFNWLGQFKSAAVELPTRGHGPWNRYLAGTVEPDVYLHDRLSAVFPHSTTLWIDKPYGGRATVVYRR